MELIEDEDSGNKFEDPNAPDFYDLGCYGIMLRWEDDTWVCCGGLRHSADDGVEYWKKPWKEIDVPMEKFLRKFVS